mgnify:CR=1 FL=1
MNKKKKHNIGKYLFYDIHRLLGFWLFYIFFRPKYYYVNGKSTKEKLKPYFKKEGAIVISNHNSFYDPVHIQMSFKLRRHHILAASDIVSSKPLFWLEKKLLSVLIDRNNFSIGSYKEIIKLLKNNKIVHFFSEGHITESDQMFEEFKDGASFFSLISKKPIIPMYIPKRKNIFKRLIICYNDPIDVSNYSKKDIDIITNLSRERCIACIDYINKKTNK